MGQIICRCEMIKNYHDAWSGQKVLKGKVKTMLEKELDFIDFGDGYREISPYRDRSIEMLDPRCA